VSVNLKSPSLTSRRRSTAESEFSIHIRPESHRQPMGSKSGASGGKRQRGAYAPVTRPVGHPGPAEAQPRPSSSQASEWGRKDDAARSASCCARCPIVTSSGIRRRRRFESERGGRRSCPSWSRRLLPDRPEGPSPGPEVTLVLPPHGIIAPAPELADIPIGVLSRLHWWRDADRRNFNSAHRRHQSCRWCAGHADLINTPRAHSSRFPRIVQRLATQTTQEDELQMRGKIRR
jgi:hypothetical protein